MTRQKQKCMVDDKFRRQVCEEKGNTFTEKGQELGQHICREGAISGQIFALHQAYSGHWEATEASASSVLGVHGETHEVRLKRQMHS